MMTIGQKVVAFFCLFFLNSVVILIFPWYFWPFFWLPSAGVALHVLKR